MPPFDLGRKGIRTVGHEYRKREGLKLHIFRFQQEHMGLDRFVYRFTQAEAEFMGALERAGNQFIGWFTGWALEQQLGHPHLGGNRCQRRAHLVGKQFRRAFPLLLALLQAEQLEFR